MYDKKTGSWGGIIPKTHRYIGLTLDNMLFNNEK